jgi:hypothetical protein
MLDVVAEEHIAIEACKIVEQSEGIPFASTEGIFAYIFCKVREEGTEYP